MKSRITSLGAALTIAALPASAPVRAADEPATCVIPKSWGRAAFVVDRGAAYDGVVFEDEQGTLRMTNLDYCKKGKVVWVIRRE